MDLGEQGNPVEKLDREADPELWRIVDEERACLARVLGYLELRRSARPDVASSGYSDLVS